MMLVVKKRRAYIVKHVSIRIFKHYGGFGLGGVLGTALSWPFTLFCSFFWPSDSWPMVRFSEAWNPHDLNLMLRMYRNRIRSGALLALCATVCGTVFLNFGGRPPSSPSRGVPQLGPHLQDVPGTRASTEEQVSWKRLSCASCAWFVGNGMRLDMLKLYTFCPRIVMPYHNLRDILALFTLSLFFLLQILTQATMQGQQWWFSMMVTSGLFFTVFHSSLFMIFVCLCVFASDNCWGW